MKLFAFGLSAIAAIALSASTASAQVIVTGGTGYGRGVVVSPGFGGSYYGGYGSSFYSPGFGNSFYTPRYNSFYTPPVVLGGYRHPSYGFGHYDYIPGHYDRHGNHYHYHPGHYDYHAPGRRAPRH